MNENKLRKSHVNRKVWGVCGGIAEYFGIDAIIIRLALVLFLMAGGSGILLYFIAAIIMDD